MKPKILVMTTAMWLSPAFVSVTAAPELNHGAAPAPLMLAAAQSHHGEGTVTAVDEQGKRIELEHGPIKSIGWMGMKMYFSVYDAELLDEVQVGDKVGFDFIETRDKRFVVTDIEVQ